MCGIAGFYRRDPGALAEQRELEPMVQAIVHRGPDSAGHFCQEGMALGMRRLSIIDIEGGEQPMFDRDRTIALTFNGEIYNHNELRQDLEQRGHVFQSRSDTEVLVYLYKEYGEEMFGHLNGMFGIAIADLKRKRVVLGRDRLGIKPMFLAERGNTLLWGSEIKCLLAHPEVQPAVNPAHLPDYLFLNYMPPDRTLFEGIEQLLPGELAVADADGVRRRTWWDLSMQADESITEAQAIEESMALLEDAVRLRLMSDVPFGAFLSGGIDSSAIVALMTRHMDQPVKTFSVGFAEQSYDERPWARQVAKQYGTEHHELVIDPGKEVLDLLPTLVEHSEEPTADSSALPVFMLSRLAREHVTMVLSGDGGDEVFAGYETHNAWAVAEKWRRVPGWIRRGIARPMIDALPVSDSKISFEFKAKRFVRIAELGPERAHFSWRRIVDEQTQRELLGAQRVGPEPWERHRHWFDAAKTNDPLGKMLYVDTRFYLPGDMLVKVDRMSMATSLEARVPFLDHRLVEYAARIPSAVKFPKGQKKHLLKQGLLPHLGHELLYRKKAGFNVPKNQWLRGPLRELVGDVLSESSLARHGLMEPAVVRRLVDEHQSQRADHSFAIWSVLIFQLWYDRFIAAH